MANSIINNDNTQMQDDEFKPYKKRFPPTFAFIRHAVSRVSEVAYRIGLLALVWTVCGGLPFVIMLGIELFLIAGKVGFLLYDGDAYDRSLDTLLLNLSQLVVLPSEEVYHGAQFDAEWHVFWGSMFCTGDENCCSSDGLEILALITVMNCCCCFLLASLLSAVSTMILDRRCDVEEYPMPTMRIGLSLMEIVFLVVYGVYAEDEDGPRKKFLFNKDHGLYVFIATCILFLIYSQYLKLFPNFALPLNASVRSKYGYAYCNELVEIQKIKVRKTEYDAQKYVLYTDNREKSKVYPPIQNAQQFWDEPIGYTKKRDVDENMPITAAIFALAKGNTDIVAWLEEQGAVAHQAITDKCNAQVCAQWMLGCYNKTKWHLASKPYSTTDLGKIKVKLPKEGYKMIDGVKYEMKTDTDFWDEPIAFVDGQPVTAAMFAIARRGGANDNIPFLEARGAKTHQGSDQDVVRVRVQQLIGNYYD